MPKTDCPLPRSFPGHAPQESLKMYPRPLHMVTGTLTCHSSAQTTHHAKLCVSTQQFCSDMKLNKSCPQFFFSDSLEFAATEEDWAINFSEGNTHFSGKKKILSTFLPRRESKDRKAFGKIFRPHCLRKRHFTIIRWCGSKCSDLILPALSEGSQLPFLSHLSLGWWIS